jgi:transcriptional regulator with XRE-family HTH domain
LEVHVDSLAADGDTMATSEPPDGVAKEFGRRLESARDEAGISRRKLAKRSGLEPKDIADLEAGTRRPTDRELGALAQACRVSVFDLLPPGYTLRILSRDVTGAFPTELEGGEALDALLREYLAMVVELRSDGVVTAPSLRHDDLVELAAALGGSEDAIKARLVALLAAEAEDAPHLLSMILPSTAAH